MTSRTAACLILHDVEDDDERESLGNLLLAGGDSVELEWISETLAVALIGPSDLENPPTEGDER